MVHARTRDSLEVNDTKMIWNTHSMVSDWGRSGFSFSLGVSKTDLQSDGAVAKVKAPPPAFGGEVWIKPLFCLRVKEQSGSVPSGSLSSSIAFVNVRTVPARRV